MKSLLKFSLLSALVIGGKFTKPVAPAAMAQSTKTKTAAGSSVIMVHQVVPVKTGRETVQPQPSGSGLIAELF